MWKTGTFYGVLNVVVFCSIFELVFCEENYPCPFKLKEDENGRCTSHRNAQYTEYYIWIGILFGVVVVLGLALFSCVCCKRCYIYKRRIAIANARSRNNAEVSTISSHLQRGHGAHGPISNHGCVPMNPSLPGAVGHQQQTSSFNQQVPLGSGNPDSMLPTYSQSSIPVFPDEPPPRYTP